MNGDTIIALLSDHGLWILAPISIIEGPIVSILAGWLVGLGIMALVPSFIILVLGDVIGDALLYAAGRGVRLDRLPLVGRYFRIPRAKLVPVVKAFREQGVRLLVIGKVTQAAGFVVLIGAGAARMNFALFLLVNTLAAIPKAALLLALGYAIGEAHERIAAWLSWGSLAMGGLAVLAFALWWLWRRRKAPIADQTE